MENPVLDLLIQYKAVEFGDFTLASGVKSKYYIDVKTAIMQPALLGEIAKEVAERYTFDAVAGVAVGGVPLAVAVSLASVCFLPDQSNPVIANSAEVSVALLPVAIIKLPPCSILYFRTSTSFPSVRATAARCPPLPPTSVIEI